MNNDEVNYDSQKLQYFENFMDKILNNKKTKSKKKKDANKKKDQHYQYPKKVRYESSKIKAKSICKLKIKRLGDENEITLYDEDTLSIKENNWSSYKLNSENKKSEDYYHFFTENYVYDKLIKYQILSDNLEKVYKDNIQLNEKKASHYYLYSHSKTKRLQIFENKCKRIQNTIKNINKYSLIKLLCENIPLNFGAKIYDGGIFSIFSKLLTDKIHIIFSDEYEIKKFELWMQNTFIGCFYNQTLCIDSVILIFDLNLSFNIRRQKFVEQILYFGSHSTEFHKSKICKFQLFNSSYGNQDIKQDEKIIQSIKNNLKNKILTIREEYINYGTLHPDFDEKMDLLLSCHEKINLGYKIKDPHNVFPGINCIITYTYSTEEIIKILDTFLVSIDTMMIIVQYLSEQIIDKHHVCSKCQLQFDKNIDTFPYIKPMVTTIIKQDHQKFYCFHGFDDTKKSIEYLFNVNANFLRTKYNDNVIFHKDCFLETIRQYPYETNAYCRICKSFFL